MRRDSRLARALWIGLLVMLGGYVVADFVRSPFLAPRGSAAVGRTEVTIWAPAGDSGGETGAVLAETAAALELDGHRSVVKVIPGGSAQATIDLLSRRTGHGDLVVVTSNMVADLAHDRHDRLVPGAAEEGALAQELLARATPIALLESEPLALAVAAGSPIRSGRGLLAALATAPESRLFGIDDDTFSRDQLAALLEGAGVDGEVRFTVFQSGAAAGEGLETGAANTVLASRGALANDVRRGRLHEVDWPLRGGTAPRAWTAVVARPGLSSAALTRLRGWVSALRRDRQWRSQQLTAGRAPAASGPRALARLLSRAPAERLERVASRVERR